MDIINTPIPVRIFLEFIFEHLFYIQQTKKTLNNKKKYLGQLYCSQTMNKLMMISEIIQQTPSTQPY